MSDKNFKVKNGLTIQGLTDTNITADGSGSISIGGSPLRQTPQVVPLYSPFTGFSVNKLAFCQLNVNTKVLTLSPDIPMGPLSQADADAVNAFFPTGSYMKLVGTSQFGTTIQGTVSSVTYVSGNIEVAFSETAGSDADIFFTVLEMSKKNASTVTTGKLLTNDGTTTSWADAPASGFNSIFMMGSM